MQQNKETKKKIRCHIFFNATRPVLLWTDAVAAIIIVGVLYSLQRRCASGLHYACTQEIESSEWPTKASTQLKIDDISFTSLTYANEATICGAGIFKGQLYTNDFTRFDLKANSHG